MVHKIVDGKIAMVGEIVAMRFNLSAVHNSILTKVPVMKYPAKDHVTFPEAPGIHQVYSEGATKDSEPIGHLVYTVKEETVVSYKLVMRAT